MNLLFCGDAGVSTGIFLGALSLCKHAKGDLHFYLLTASVGAQKGISQDFAQQLRTALQKKREGHRVTLLDLSEVFGGYLPLANMGTRFTPLCMLRLFADLVPQIPDRILYLDTDVLCNGAFEALEEMDLGDIEIAGVPDRYGKWFFGNPLRHTYLNSGVLLMNMENIRRSGLFEKCRRMCREKKMFLPDQTALNKLAVKAKLPGRYNNQGKLKKDTVFQHFTTYFRFFPRWQVVTIKPWQEDRLHGELKLFAFDDILEAYKKEYKG